MSQTNEEIALELVKLALKENLSSTNRPAELYAEFLKKVYVAQEDAMKDR